MEIANGDETIIWFGLDGGWEGEIRIGRGKERRGIVEFDKLVFIIGASDYILNLLVVWNLRLYFILVVLWFSLY